MTTRTLDLCGRARVMGALLIAAAITACRAPLPLPAAPGARAVAVARAADALSLLKTLSRAGLLDDEHSALGPLVVGDAPLVASALPGGGFIIATQMVTRPRGKSDPVAGATSRFDLGDGKSLLARFDRERAIVGLHVPAGADIATAALIELMAHDANAATPPLPGTGDVVIRVPASPVGPLELVLRAPSAWEIATTIVASAPPAALKTALAAPLPPWACALDEGAAAVLSVPPFDGSDDDFIGRMMVALYPASSQDLAVIIAGERRDPADVVRFIDDLRRGPWQIVEAVQGERGERRVIRVLSKRPLTAVIEPGVFALGVGGAPVERVGGSVTCPAGASARPLVRIDGKKLHNLLLPRLMRPADILQFVMSGGEADVPLAELRGLEHFELDGRVEGDVVRFDARARLTPAAP